MTWIEHGAGLPVAYTVGFTRTPPWSLPLAMPFGLLPLRLATLLWSLILLGCLFYSVHFL
jgi:hypothetical protein